jgi:pyridoxamine 5'-phosphate oxidase-like protein
VKDVDKQIDRAKELLRSALHAAMATVNEDDSPHNTPYFFMCSADLRHLYWGSHPQSEHSRNALRTGQLFVVLYDAFERGGLFIRADGARIAGGDELTEALAEHNRRRALRGQEPLPREYYEGGRPQRMWIAAARQFWVNGTERDTDNRIVRDIRTEILRTDLLA